jgi:hypothetical protein
MSAEPTSALTFEDLILEAALEAGRAYYGEDGNEVAQIPVNIHDLNEMKRHVNNAIRMFISDAPPTGWRWTRPTSAVALWPTVTADAARTMSGGAYNADENETLMTANSPVFFESMEEKSLIITGFGSVVIKRYVSATTAYVYGNASAVTNATYAIAANGDYTLPRTFAGSFTGAVTFTAGTNRAVQLEWADEAQIRRMRENVTLQKGTPRYVAVGVFVPTAPNVPASLRRPRRRYRLEVFPQPGENYTVRFPYDLHFDSMVELGEVPPTPIVHDETIRAAVLAVVERDVHDTQGPRWGYYAKCLDNSKNIDARSGPRKLGYFGNGKGIVTPRNFRDFMQRPNVSYDTP